jgi:GNAT superfamily N-acetyltransferase
MTEARMHRCSLHKDLEIVAGDRSDYERLAPYHYREGRPAVVSAVFTVQSRRAHGCLGRGPAGVIVYAMPNPRLELRGVATNHCFAGLDRQTELALLNRNVRCIARVIIEPRWRGIGLASRLVRETMPLLKVPIVEALGVMPLVNPFLEKAGLTAFAPRIPLEHMELLEAFSVIGVEEDSLVDPDAVQNRIDELMGPAAHFLEARIQQFLKSHGTRRTMPAGIARTRYILGKLTHRPAYYIWFNPLMMVEDGLLISDAQPTSLPVMHLMPQSDHSVSEVSTP